MTGRPDPLGVYMDSLNAMTDDQVRSLFFGLPRRVRRYSTRHLAVIAEYRNRNLGLDAPTPEPATD